MLVLVSAGAIFFFISKGKQDLQAPVYSIPDSLVIPSQESEEGEEDDPESRLAYEVKMLADPATGTIPDIRKQEVAFAARLPKKYNISQQLRKSQINDVGVWQSSGPYNVGGRTRALALDISNENVIIAGGVSGGMWRSEDSGDHWSIVTSPLSLHSVTCIAQDTRAGKQNIWYYGTGEIIGNSASKSDAAYRGDGIFKSNDGGKHWTLLPSTALAPPNIFGSQFQYIWNVITNPFANSQDEVYAATVGSIFRSIDGGSSWQAVLGPTLNNDPNQSITNGRISSFTDIAITYSGAFYATLSQNGINGSSLTHGIYRSADGVNWVNITPANWPDKFSRTVIGASPSNPDVVYFVADADQEMIWKYNYISGNGTGAGGRWTNLSENLPEFGGQVGDYDTQGSYDMVIKVHPDNENVVFLGGTNVYRSTDGFSTQNNIQWIGGYDTTNTVDKYPNHFVDQHAFVFYPSNPKKMLTGNDGGVFITENAMAAKVSWRPLNNGYITAQFYTVALDVAGKKGYIFGGLMDNGVYAVNSTDLQNFWKSIVNGDGGFCAIAKDAQYIYASTQSSRILRLTFDNNLQYTSFTRVDPFDAGEKSNQEYLFINPFVLDPGNQNVMFLAGGDKIWRNDNLAQIPIFNNNKTSVNWVSLEKTAIAKGQISAISISSNPGEIVYFGTSTGKLYKINNARSINYEVNEIGLGQFPADGFVNCIAVSPQNADHLMVVFSNYNVISIFNSYDGGASFQSVSGNLEEHPDGSGSGPSVRWMDIIPLTSGKNLYLAGTSTGLYSCEDLNGDNTIWTQEAADLIGHAVVSMIRYRTSDNLIVAATHGNGVFTTRLNDIVPIMPEIPAPDFAVSNAYPNPFSDKITMPFYIPADGPVRIQIYNATGQLVKTLMWAHIFKGQNSVTWDGTNNAGVKMASGPYICRVEYSNKQRAKKLIYINQ